ncbi:hypothetical protein Smic_78360 [Streptomyces microflavus]|uniref:Uncharacterized protein n=1 Tax=Streptomyces microflavus TaxID=1919 RepID=A0A7J0D3H4_STRMI|nr:hypothetical protein Smic_78360 [Streptomyces microflavus]
MVPRRLGKVRVLGDTTTAAHCYVELRDSSDHSCTARCVLTDAAGAVLAEADAIECISVPHQSAGDLFDHRTLDVSWEKTALPRATDTAGCWNLCHEPDREAEARNVQAALQAHGAEAVLHPMASTPIGRLGAPARGVVYFPSLDDAPGAAVRARDNVLQLTRLAQALIGHSDQPIPRLWAVTRGAQQVLPDDIPGLAGAGLRGALRVVALEHSALHPVHLDVDLATTRRKSPKSSSAAPEPTTTSPTATTPATLPSSRTIRSGTRTGSGATSTGPLKVRRCSAERPRPSMIWAWQPSPHKRPAPEKSRYDCTPPA